MRRTAWCFVHRGSRAHTPVERFESSEMHSRPGSAIPHYHPSSEDLHGTHPEGNGKEGGTGYPHTYLNVPKHLHVSPSPPGTPGTPASYVTGRSDPWAIRRRSAPATPSSPYLPPRPETDDEDTIQPFNLDSPGSVTTPRAPSPTLQNPRPPYATTTQRLGSRPVSLLDKASEMGIESPELPDSEGSRKQLSVPGTPRRRSSAEAVVRRET
jgi:hypothetical protein